MITQSRNRKIFGAYLTLFAVAVTLVIVDPLQRATQSQLADLPIPTQLPEPAVSETVRLASRLPPGPEAAADLLSY